jgi:hypothetical protein
MEDLEELKLVIRDCYGFDKQKFSDQKLVEIFQQLEVDGVGRVAAGWLVTLFGPRSAFSSAVHRGNISRDEIYDLILSAQKEEMKYLSLPLSIVVCRLRDNVTLASYASIRNGFLKLELQTACTKLADDIVRGHLAGRALRNIAIGECHLDCAVDRKRKYLVMIASSTWSSNLQNDAASRRSRCLQELLEATCACSTRDFTSANGLAEELAPTIKTAVQRIGSAAENPRRDSIVEHLNITAMSLMQGLRPLVPDAEPETEPDDADVNYGVYDDDSGGTDASVVDGDDDSDTLVDGDDERKSPRDPPRKSYIDARNALDLGDPQSWKVKHTQRKSLWLTTKEPSAATDASVVDEVVDEAACSDETSAGSVSSINGNVGTAGKSGGLRKSVSFADIADCEVLQECRPSYIEAQKKLYIGEPEQWKEEFAERKSLWLTTGNREHLHAAVDAVGREQPQTTKAKRSNVGPVGSSIGLDESSDPPQKASSRPSYVAAREGLLLGDPESWNAKNGKRHSLWLSHGKTNAVDTC